LEYSQKYLLFGMDRVMAPNGVKREANAEVTPNWRPEVYDLDKEGYWKSCEKEIEMLEKKGAWKLVERTHMMPGTGCSDARYPDVSQGS